MPSARVLYFGPTVEDADIVAWRLKSWGISAASVDAKTKPGTRRRIIKNFKEGTIKILCNCQLLTTGFDVPEVTHVVVGRPTVSTVLYEQMIGRGLRGPQFGGTAYCSIINVRDKLSPYIDSVLAYERISKEWEVIKSGENKNSVQIKAVEKTKNVKKESIVNKPTADSFWERFMKQNETESTQSLKELDLSIPIKYIEKRDYRSAYNFFNKYFRGVKSDSSELYFLWAFSAIYMNEIIRVNICIEALEKLKRDDMINRLRLEMQKLNRAS